MDGSVLKPIGTASPAGDYGRFDNPDATAGPEGLRRTPRMTPSRTTALDTLQKVFVEQVPMIPVGSDNIGMAYSTKNWIGWPDDANPYGAGQPTQAERAGRRPASEARQLLIASPLPRTASRPSAGAAPRCCRDPCTRNSA